jgi:hypothetical protein
MYPSYVRKQPDDGLLQLKQPAVSFISEWKFCLTDESHIDIISDN